MLRYFPINQYEKAIQSPESQLHGILAILYAWLNDHYALRIGWLMWYDLIRRWCMQCNVPGKCIVFLNLLQKIMKAAIINNLLSDKGSGQSRNKFRVTW